MSSRTSCFRGNQAGNRQLVTGNWLVLRAARVGGLLEGLDLAELAAGRVQVGGNSSRGLAEGRRPCGNVACNSVVSDGSSTLTVWP